MISVIMGVYNAEKTIERAVRSLYEYKGEIEVIAVNDGSTDNTAGVLDALKKQFSTLKVFSNEKNRGLTYSLNLAFSKSCGEFIARLDADDVNAENRFEKQLLFMSAHSEYAFCSGNAILFDEDGDYARRKFTEKVTLDDIIRENPFIHPALFIRRSALEKVGGYRDIKKTNRCEDYDLIFRLYAEGLYGCNLNEDLIYYYENRNGASKHSFKTRKNEFYVRRYGSKINKSKKGALLSFKPLILSVLPAKLYKKLHKSKQQEF